jgi:transposase
MSNERILATKYEALRPALNERTRRLWAGTEATAWGRGGIATVMRVTGMSRNTVVRGVREATEANPPGMDRLRTPGGGRKAKAVLDPGLTCALERLVEPASRGDPESPLRWTCKGTRRLAQELRDQGYLVSHRLVATLLHELDYSLQGNRKTKEGTHHPDRNAQFEYISRKVSDAMARNQPAISVDTKKKGSSPDQLSQNEA